MKFSPREKRLLIVLGIVFLFVVYVNFFLRPQLKQITKLSDEIGTYTKSYEMNKAIEAKVKKMDSEMKILSQKLKDLRAIFPPVVNYDEVLITVRDIAKNSGLDVGNIAFVEPVEVPKDEVKADAQEAKKDTSGKKASQETQITDMKLKALMDNLGIVQGGNILDSGLELKKAKISDGSGYIMSVKIGAKGTNAQFKSFISAVSGLKNKVSFRDMQINNGINGELTANVTLDFYGIMDKNAGQYTMLQDGTWTPLKAKGSDNMFLPYAGYVSTINTTSTVNNVVQNNPTTESNSTGIWKYDFSMRVLPYGNEMAPPTVAMVCVNSVQNPENYRVPVIYGDSNNEEFAELYVEEKEGKFYFKFMTQNDAFPDVSYSQLAEFNPAENDIKFLIDSTPRKNPNDNSGVNINVINKTSKNLVVKVINEDKQKPRVKVNKSGANIRVEF